MCIYLAAAAVHAAGLLYCYDLHLLSTLSASWQEERRARRAAALLRRAAAGRPGGGGNATAATVAAAVAGMEGSWAPRFEWQGPFWVHAAAQVGGLGLGAFLGCHISVRSQCCYKTLAFPHIGSSPAGTGQAQICSTSSAFSCSSPTSASFNHQVPPLVSILCLFWNVIPLSTSDPACRPLYAPL